MPVGISSTARLTAAKSINSGISSSLYTDMGLLASIARARNDSLLILAYLRQRMDASAVKRWQKRPKCLSNTHISFHLHIFDDVLSGYLTRDENYALGRSTDARFAATCNVSFCSIMADRVTIDISQRAVRTAICRLRSLDARVGRLSKSRSLFLFHFGRLPYHNQFNHFQSFYFCLQHEFCIVSFVCFFGFLAKRVILKNFLKRRFILRSQKNFLACNSYL